MSQINVDSIYDKAGTGSPDFPNSLKVNGNDFYTTTTHESTWNFGGSLTSTLTITLAQIGPFKFIHFPDLFAIPNAATAGFSISDVLSADWRPTISQVRNPVTVIDDGSFQSATGSIQINTTGSIYLYLMNGVLWGNAATCGCYQNSFVYI